MRNKEKTIGDRMLKFAEEQSDFSPEALANIPFIQLCGRNRVEIEGIYKLLECTSNNIVIKLKKDSICLCGSNLYIKHFTEKNAVIEGKVTSIEFL